MGQYTQRSPISLFLSQRGEGIISRRQGFAISQLRTPTRFHPKLTGAGAHQRGLKQTDKYKLMRVVREAVSSSPLLWFELSPRADRRDEHSPAVAASRAGRVPKAGPPVA
jgi:hypothetical protein